MISGRYFRSLSVNIAGWSRLQSCRMSTDIILESINNVGVITLNREKLLNVMSNSMMSQILSSLKQWENEKIAVIFRGNKNFSAGADLKSLWGSEERTHMMIVYLYHILHTLTTYKIPTIAFMDGTTVGSGLSICAFSRYGVVTENSIVAMPEAKIGMIPGSYVFSKLDNHLGYYLGTTGTTLKGKDAWRSGLATHFTPKAKLKDLERCLLDCKTSEEIPKVLDSFNEKDYVLPLAESIKEVDYCFRGENIEEIMKRLEEVGSEWSKKAIAELRRACPGSAKVALKSLQMAKDMDASHCLKKDFHILHWSMRTHDFQEGTRGLLFEKGYKAQWNPKSLEEVTEEYVDTFFRPMPDDFLHLPPTPPLSSKL